MAITKDRRLSGLNNRLKVIKVSAGVDSFGVPPWLVGGHLLFESSHSDSFVCEYVLHLPSLEHQIC